MSFSPRSRDTPYLRTVQVRCAPHVMALMRHHAGENPQRFEPLGSDLCETLRAVYPDWRNRVEGLRVTLLFIPSKLDTLFFRRFLYVEMYQLKANAHNPPPISP
jgi:hypothetical protein